jgi:hypothetical protein
MRPVLSLFGSVLVVSLFVFASKATGFNITSAFHSVRRTRSGVLRGLTRLRTVLL